MITKLIAPHGSAGTARNRSPLSSCRIKLKPGCNQNYKEYSTFHLKIHSCLFKPGEILKIFLDEFSGDHVFDFHQGRSSVRSYAEHLFEYIF